MNGNQVVAKHQLQPAPNIKKHHSSLQAIVYAIVRTGS